MELADRSYDPSPGNVPDVITGNPAAENVLPGTGLAGFTVTLAPTKNSYLNYGLYDGNIANGVQTGLTGVHFNGYYFTILETGVDWVAARKYPGELGVGGWYQTGELHGPGKIAQDGTGGFYLFGGQRIWVSSTQPPIQDGKGEALIPTGVAGHHASISAFFQFGVNNAETLLVKDYFGAGLTGFGLIPLRPNDTIGVGMAWSWLNPNLFNRPSELMFQGYYQAHLYAGTFFQPAISYIPTPGANSKFGSAVAVTFRFTFLF